jgi:hypothetical protein
MLARTICLFIFGNVGEYLLGFGHGSTFLFGLWLDVIGQFYSSIAYIDCTFVAVRSIHPSQASFIR